MHLTRLFLFSSLILLIAPLKAQLPEDFTDQLVADNWQSVVGITFDDNGRMYSWSKNGLVHISDNGDRLTDPLLDITEECADWGDHGLLGFALHPNFLNNGHFFVLYVVDRHHLFNFGTPAYNPAANITHQASIGRVVRYTADPASNFTTLLPDSRRVLIGDSIHNGLPILHGSHGVGTLAFGKDGTLLLTMGDGGSYAGTDVGNDDAGAYAIQALADGIIGPTQNVGAFRAQQINSLNGKVLRIDPETGAGVASNPFFDPANPFAARSRVWTLGLRNPYRFSIQPGTGSHNPADGDPGVLWVGDVGWAYWEEINRVDQGGTNLGWPIYEGLRTRWQYHGRPTQNPDAINPLAGRNGCMPDHFYFQDLLQESHVNPPTFFPNPCNPLLEVPQDIPTFVHQRPVIAWSNVEWNSEEQDTHVPGYDADGNAIIHSLNDPDCPVEGTMFNGKCSSGGVWLDESNSNWPEAYRNQFYGADYTGWFKGLRLDENQQLSSVSEFFADGENIVCMAANPLDGCLYYVEYAFLSTVRKICFGGNPPPTAVIEADKYYGAAPLGIQFSGMASTDPQNEPLTYRWNFGDGTISEEAEPTHTFASVGGKPTPYLVSLTVTDSAGGSHAEYVTISVDNTPPAVQIISFEDGATYPMTGVTELPLKAAASDAEEEAQALSYSWQVFLHHNTHNHPEALDFAQETMTYLFPEGCGEEDFWYRIRVTVRDAGGLEAYDERELFPRCSDPLTIFDQIEADADEQRVQVRTNTLREVAGSQMVVERSADKIRFSEIGSLSAKGPGSTYAFLDIDPLFGIGHYRVKVLAPDGSVEFSPVVEAKFPGISGVRLQPMPFESLLEIVYEEVVGKATFTIMTLTGQVVTSISWEENGVERKHALLLSELPAGIYLYEATDGRGRYVGKLISQ